MPEYGRADFVATAPDGKLFIIECKMKLDNCGRAIFQVLDYCRQYGYKAAPALATLQGKASQAADLADAFHELPIIMISQDFSWEIFRTYLETYQRKYPRIPDSEFNYLALLEKIIRGDPSL